MHASDVGCLVNPPRGIWGEVTFAGALGRPAKKKIKTWEKLQEYQNHDGQLLKE